MSHHRLVPAGATITRTYLAIPGPGPVIGREFPNTDEGWDAAVTAAQAKKADLVARNAESLGKFGTPEEIEEGANIQVRIDLRWKIDYPDGDGVDTIIESYDDVDRLRTRASFQAAR